MSAGMDPLKSAPQIDQQMLDVWKKCQDVAMHFNELLQNFRLKAIGAITLGAIISVGLKVVDTSDFSHHRIIAYFFFGLAAVWSLVAVLDFLYYHRLLAGAVDELLRIERQFGGKVYLSHQIEHRVQFASPASGSDPKLELSHLYGKSFPGTLPSTPVWFFYGVPLAILVLAGWFIGSGHCCSGHCKVSQPCCSTSKSGGSKQTSPSVCNAPTPPPLTTTNPTNQLQQPGNTPSAPSTNASSPTSLSAPKIILPTTLVPNTPR